MFVFPFPGPVIGIKLTECLKIPYPGLYDIEDSLYIRIFIKLSVELLKPVIS